MSEGSRTGPLREGVDADDLARVARLLGVRVGADDAAVVLDPRGPAFQRLEWQGDSALDAVVAVHRFTTPACCADVPSSALVSDAALAVRADAVGLDGLLDWRPSAHRLADTVEACVGAAWHVSVEAAVVVVARLVHGEVAPAEVGPRPDLVDLADALRCDGLAPSAQVGSAVMEASAADDLYARAEHDAADEGELSGLRALLLDGERVLQVAGDLGWLPGCDGHRNHLLDHVQSRVGLLAVHAGLPAGLLEAQRLW